MQCRKPPLPALTVKLSKYNVDDVALGVCKTGAEEAGVTEVRTSLSEKKVGVWRGSKSRNQDKTLIRKTYPAAFVQPLSGKNKIFNRLVLITQDSSFYHEVWIDLGWV